MALFGSCVRERLTLRFLSLLPLLLTIFFVLSNSFRTHVSAAEDDSCNFSKYLESGSDALNAAKKMIEPLVGKKYTSYDGTSYQFEVGICAKVIEDSSDYTAVMQTALKDGKISEGTQPYKIGSLKDTHIMAGTDWVMLEYRGGETYQSHCGNEPKRATIMITCDANVDDDSAKMMFMKENRDKEESCYYLFEMKHMAVCPEPASSGLSIGSIIVIVFFSVVAVYLLVGFLYQRFVLGAKGIEQIPNYDFWKDFGNLQADGCDLICRTKEHRHRGRGGLGDDQLDPMEEVRDDNLLPM